MNKKYKLNIVVELTEFELSLLKQLLLHENFNIESGSSNHIYSLSCGYSFYNDNGVKLVDSIKSLYIKLGGKII